MKPNARLWTIQSLLAALFLFAGVFKLITPTDVLTAQAHMSGEFIKFIGVCETLGGLGLILPGLTKIRTELTPLAAAGLVIIMIGAVVTSLIQGAGIGSAFPGVVGVLAFYVARGRWTRVAEVVQLHRPVPALRRAA